MDVKRIGIIGFGGIARGAHLPLYAQCPEARITAVCDTDEQALAAAKERLPEAKLYRDYRELIAGGLVDAVDICTPNVFHCPVALAAVEAGLPFSVEKPLGMDYRETVRLRDAAGAAGVPGFICFSWRFNKYLRFMKTMVDSGALGRIYHIYMRSIKDSGLIPGRPLEWRFDRALAGSGVLCDLGSHMLDALRFFGEEFESVYAETGIHVPRRAPVGGGEPAAVTTDDYAHLILRLQSGVSATVAVSRSCKSLASLTEFELYGEKGMLRYSAGREQVLEVSLGPDADIENRVLRRVEPPAVFEANQSQAFVDLLFNRADPRAAVLDDGLRVQALIDAALRSAALHRPVSLDEITEAAV